MFMKFLKESFSERLKVAEAREILHAFTTRSSLLFDERTYIELT